MGDPRDPLETTNLAQTQPKVVAKLRALLASQPEVLPQKKGFNSEGGEAQK